MKFDAYVATRGWEGNAEEVIVEAVFWIGSVLQVGTMEEEATEEIVGPLLQR